VREAETDQAMLLLHQAAEVVHREPLALDDIVSLLESDGVDVLVGDAATVGLDAEVARAASAAPGRPLAAPRHGAVAFFGSGAGGAFVQVRVRIPEARRAVLRLYGFVTVALLAVYGLVAAALEGLVLPQHVYRPIRRMLEAERAVQAGRAEGELIPESEIPADELGEIMRSRNQSIVLIRQHERDLADALTRLEEVANDLKRKNHLLENARRNLADAGRLASLGMMSAGVAHELNTPLAVVKGLVERLAARPDRSADEAEVALLLRVLGRLERLSESLLDLARVRPPRKTAVDLGLAVREAVTLVDLDRGKGRVRFEQRIPEGFVVEADADRLVQVLVNLLRNAVDALQGSAEDAPCVEIAAERARRDGADWVSVRVLDNGPGIDPAVLPDIFEPFVSTRLDARGTGLGLAVAEGIVREHGGVLLARNRPGRSGAEFEIMLPTTDAAAAPGEPAGAPAR
jgi:C4-dicarboxylate-specific signal transduction histidine kinase